MGGDAIALPVVPKAMVLANAGRAPDAASSLFVAAFNLGINGCAPRGVLLTTTSITVLPLVAVATGATLAVGTGLAAPTTPAAVD